MRLSMGGWGKCEAANLPLLTDLMAETTLFVGVLRYLEAISEAAANDKA
ncbi:MAG: hypothetical protein ACM3SV_07225 [Betaproteobacteria bacterium]